MSTQICQVDIVDSIAQAGFAIARNLIPAGQIEDLQSAVDASGVHQDDPHPRPKGGVRNLLHKVPAILDLANSPKIRDLIGLVLGAEAAVVRGILFDKTPQANWKVPWHQDLTIALQNRADVDGFGPWTIKDGVHHVQPPVACLEHMLAIRIHLDDCGEDNAPVKVIPGSHCMGRLSAGRIQELSETHPHVSCTCSRGDALLMRPLLLHASSAATTPARRRVIHLEYAAFELPSVLRWLS